MLDPRGCVLLGKREFSNEWASAGHERERERERECASKHMQLLYSLGIILAWVWEGPGGFSKEPNNFPSFHRLLIGLHPLVRLTGLYDPAPPPYTPNTRSGTRGGKGGVLIPLVEQCCDPLGLEAVASAPGLLSSMSNSLLLPFLINS